MPAAKPGPDATTGARDARRLSTLLEASQALSGTLNLKSALQRVLGTLLRHHSVVRGMITLLRDGELHVEAVEGFEDRARTIRIKLGEGITGKVVESGKPIVVPRVSREPAFLNLAPRRPEHPKQELSFICVPIGFDRRVVGALGVNLKFKPDEQEMKCLIAPEAFAQVPNAWGKQGWTTVTLSKLKSAELKHALEMAWRHALPKKKIQARAKVNLKARKR